MIHLRALKSYGHVATAVQQLVDHAFFFFHLQEKAALAKELNDKSTVLAGVRDKTKAYVEKLNNEKVAALAALEEQVRLCFVSV